MRAIKPQKLGILTRPFEHERVFRLGVAALAFFRFDRRLDLLPEIAMWKLVAEELGKDAVLDAAIPKSRAEFLVAGHAFAPGRAPAQTVAVRVRVGARQKTIYVIGDRRWEQDVPTEPEPFTRMPLDWDHAFGGPSYATNPRGIGHRPVEKDGVRVHALPNVELPGHMITSPRDRPEPASYGPIDFTWRQRARHAGTYDREWLEDLFPGFARDLDWRIWNLAPEDQQVDAPFQGDERLSFRNMHPDKPRLRGALPGVLARAFVTLRAEEGERFEEVPMRATTAWLLPHVERGVLIFHGSVPITEDDGADVVDVMVAAEALGQPKPLEHYRRVRELRSSATERHLHLLRDADLLPEGCEPADPEIEELRGKLVGEGLLQANLRERGRREIERAREIVASHGLDPDEHAPKLPGPAEEPPSSIEALPAFFEKKLEEAARMREGEERRVAEIDARMRVLFDEIGPDAGLSWDDIVAERTAASSGPPTFRADAMLERMRAIADECAALGQPVDEIEAYLAEGTFERQWRDAELKLGDAYRAMVHHQLPAPRPEEERARALGEELVRLARAGASLFDRDFTGADLSAQDLAGSSLAGVFLESANLRGTGLVGADLSRAVLAHADLSGADLSRANLAGANLGGATFFRTRAHAADLTDAILAKVDVKESDLSGACFARTDLTDARFTGSKLAGIQAAQLVLRGVHLDGTDLSGADLREAVLLHLSLVGANLDRATLVSTLFLGPSAQGASFRHADLTNARFVSEAKLEEACFEGASMSGACLRGARLARARMRGCILDASDLSEADLDGADLRSVRARGAMFIRASFLGAKLTGADLMNALLSKATLGDTDLRQANLFGADFARARSVAPVDLEGANTTKARVHPRRAP